MCLELVSLGYTVPHLSGQIWTNSCPFLGQLVKLLQLMSLNKEINENCQNFWSVWQNCYLVRFLKIQNLLSFEFVFSSLFLFLFLFLVLS